MVCGLFSLKNCPFYDSRIRYSTSDDYKFFDVYPANTNSVSLPNLLPGQQYSVGVMAFNNLGESNYTDEPTVVRTSRKFNIN